MSEQQAPITEERLKEIAERANAATAGPWMVGEGEPVEGCPFRHVDGWTDTGEEWLCLSSEDAAFIAQARADIPDMLAEIHRLRAKLQEHENTIAGLRAQTTTLMFTTSTCTFCGRTAKDLPEGYSLIGKMAVMGSGNGPHYCYPNCPPKAPTDSTQGEGTTTP